MASRALRRSRNRDGGSLESLESVRMQRTAEYVGDGGATSYDLDAEWDLQETSEYREAGRYGRDRDGDVSPGRFQSYRSEREYEQGEEQYRRSRTRFKDGRRSTRDSSPDFEDETNTVAMRGSYDLEQRDRRLSADFFPGDSPTGHEGVQEKIRRTRERREKLETWEGGRLQSREAWSETHESHEDIDTRLEEVSDGDEPTRSITTRRHITEEEQRDRELRSQKVYGRMTQGTKPKAETETGTASMTLAVGRPEAVNGEIARATVPPKEIAESPKSESWKRTQEHRRRVAEKEIAYTAKEVEEIKEGAPVYSTVEKKKSSAAFQEPDRDSFYYNNLVSGQDDRDSSTAGLTPREVTAKRWFGLQANISWVYAALLISIGLSLIVAALVSTLITPFAYIWYILALLIIGLVAILIFYAFAAYRRAKGEHDEVARTESTLGSHVVGGPHAVTPKSQEGTSAGRSDLNPSFLSSGTGTRSVRSKRWPNIGHVPLRAAVALVGLCALLFAVFWFILHIYIPCLDDIFKIVAILAAVFILLQLPLLYFNRRMNDVKIHFLAKWGMMHLFVVDVLLALLAMFFVIDYHTRFRLLSGNFHNLTCDQIDNFTFLHGTALRVCEFDHPFAKQFYYASLALYPLFIIFLFLACVILVFAWKNLSSHYHYYREDDRSWQSWVSAKAYGALCGAAIGALLILLTVVMIVMFFVFWNTFDDPQSAYMSFRGTELGLNAVVVILVIMGPLLMREMGTDQLKDVSLYTVIMVFALVGVFIYEVFYAIACHRMAQIRNEMYIIGLAKSVVSIVAGTFQTVFLLVAMRLYCRTATQIHDAPGRSTITLLLMCNIALILTNIFENFINEFDLVSFNVYGLVPWTVIQHVFVPFMILYRIICAIAAIVIWKKAYEIPRTALRPTDKTLY